MAIYLVFVFTERWRLLEVTVSETSHPADRSDLEVGQGLKREEQRGRWHWRNVVLTITPLMGTILILSSNDGMFEQLTIAVRGLLVVVMLLCIYSFYQGRLLRRLRRDLEIQIGAVHDQRMRADAFYELAMFDPLTSLYNRRFGEERLRTEIARADRHGCPLMVILLDLDKLKTINDLFGHAVGDIVLREFAHRLQKATRGSDIAARLGGDEFLIILPECSDEKVQIVLSRLTDFQIDTAGGKVLVSCSRGWAQYLIGESAEELLGRGDQALYASKAHRSVAAY
jgi:diguanylate cyclase (GGDEF)-like protein